MPKRRQRRPGAPGRPPAAPRRAAGTGKARTLGALAAALGVNRSTLDTWLPRGCPGKGRDGLYDVDRVRAWRATNIARPHFDPRRDPMAPEEVRRKGKGDPTDWERLRKAQADEREAKARMLELELAASEGEYILRAEVCDRDVARIHVVRRGLDGLARSLPLRLEGMMASEMEHALRASFQDLCDKWAALSDPAAVARPPPPPPARQEDDGPR